MSVKNTRCSGSKTAKNKGKNKIKVKPNNEDKYIETYNEHQDETQEVNFIEFQVVDWNYYHEIDDDDEETYVIQIFGRTENDKDICVKVTGFKPYFFVEIPDGWGLREINIFIDAIKNKIQWRTTNNPKFEYDYSKSLVNYSVVNKKKFYGFTNNKMFKFLKLEFKSYTAMRLFSMLLANPIKIKGLSNFNEVLYQRYESNIEPHLRFIHINNLSTCGWVKILKKFLIDNKEYSHCNLSYETFWKNVKPADNDTRMSPLKIMGYDIECITCDHNFPQANRKTDKIIQIGITVYRYGSMKCEEEHILVLGCCSPINGANVQCYKTEKSLLLGFAKKISEIRPDIKAGYNNHGFDDKYIYDRIVRIDKETAEKKGIKYENLENSFLKEFLTTMGKAHNEYIIKSERLRNSLTTYEEKQLSSSALGDNILRYFQVPGIISIDVMKVIQRDHKLTGYKLDNVSANFITEEAKKVSFDDNVISDSDQLRVSIYTKSTKALDIGSYIQIMVDDGYSPSPLREGAKYYVKDILTIEDFSKGEKVIVQCIKIDMDKKDFDELEEIYKNELLTVYWTFAKDDIHHTDINKFFKQKNPKKVRLVAKYCLKDCKLVNLLLAKLEIIINNIGMAKVCIVPFSYLFMRGQGVKVFSLVSKECRKQGYLIPVLVKKNKDLTGDEDETYEGATVITPIPGVYLAPIGVLDYNSLYPQSIRERNMSHETYVDNPKYDNLTGYRYHDIFITKKDKKGKIVRNDDGSEVQTHHRFAEEISQTENRKYGIIPQILTNLLNSRAETNGKLKTEKDPSVALALNGLQLAYKITANSVYGQTGAPTSPIYMLPIAASTATVGRERLYFARKIVEDNFKGSKVIYGDSVTGDTPLTLKKDNQISVVTIKDLNDNWEPYEEFKKNESNRTEKQQTLVDYQVWTDKGWANIKRVIRHKTNKKIFRVLTNTGCIDVTEDHSLLDINKCIIKPEQCNIGTELLHGFPDLNGVYDDISLKEAFVLGFFMENGCCTNSWTLNSTNLEILNQCKEYLEHIENIKFEIYNANKLVPVEHNQVIVNKYNNLFYDSNKNKLVPNIILNSNKEIKQSFLDGYFTANRSMRCDTPTKITAQCLFYLLKSLNYDVLIDIVNDKYRLSYSFLKQKENPNAIKDITYMGMSNDFVYDLETESGTFQAGIGQIIVKNTDSIFINFGLKDDDGNERTDETALMETIELSKKAAALINAAVPNPQRIVYEKTMHPFILIAKKKYVGLLYTFNTIDCELKAMGIVLKRRDNAPIVKIIVGGIINSIIKYRNVETAIEYAKNVIMNMMIGKYPIDKFIVSKTLKGVYKKPKSIAHKVLADRMTARDPGNAPQVNDRIPYVYVYKDLGTKKKKDILQGDLIEPPSYVIENELTIDYLYYLEHQIINPATQILELMMSTNKVGKFFDTFIIEEWNKRRHRQSMERWFDDSKEKNDNWEPMLE